MLEKFKQAVDIIKESIINNKNIANIEDDLDDKIIYFAISHQGEEYQKRIKSAFNNTLNQFKSKYPNIFNKTKIYFDLIKTDIDLYAELDEQSNIRVNMYPIFEKLYFYDLKKNNNNYDILDDILDEYEFDKCIIAHELAHIIDMKQSKIKDFYSYNQAHSNGFKKAFQELTGKNFDTINENTHSQKNMNIGRFKIFDCSEISCLGSADELEELLKQIKFECKSSVKILDSLSGMWIWEGNPISIPSDEIKLSIYANDIIEDNTTPNFNKQGLLTHFTYNELLELSKYDLKHKDVLKNKAEDLKMCIEGPWNTGDQTIEQMFKEREAGHMIFTENDLAQILNICKQYFDNNVLKNIYNKNITVYDDFQLFKTDWPKHRKQKYGCKCGHFGGLKKNDMGFSHQTI